MSEVSELLSVSLINKVMEKGNTIFVFASGAMRGKLISAKTASAVPSQTYLKDVRWSFDKPPIETCAALTFIPSPQKPDKVKDPRTFKFTRQPQTFWIPERALVAKCLHLTRVEGDTWMLNIVSDRKGEATG